VNQTAAGWLWNGVMYRVQGASVYSYTTDGTRTKIGTVANDGLRCRFRLQLRLPVDRQRGNLYYYSPTGFSEAEASIASGGTGYTSGNDTLTLGPLGIYATVQGYALSQVAITGATIQNNPQVQTKFLPTNPIPQVLSSGGGTGASFNVTWTSLGNFIQINFSRSTNISIDR
jgi:hypothetical protein